jgi:hypothetical protein
MPGFPIRTPWDHSLVDSSPRPIAASHVLHRLLVPRHPPFALDNLTTKMLASTVQFSTNDQPTTRHVRHQTRTTPGGMPHQAMPGRPPETPTASNQPPKDNHTVVPSGPNRVLYTHHQPHQDSRSHHRSSCTRKNPAVAGTKLTSVSAIEHPTTTFGQCGLLTTFRWKVLLRKEVIQPHLPVRLPCYDFVPIASPTFDGSLHTGWATGFGCCRLS